MMIFLLVVINIFSTESLTINTKIAIDGKVNTLYAHLLEKRTNEYDQWIFRKYVRLFNAQTNIPAVPQKKNFYNELKDGVLDASALQNLRDNNYYLFKSAPILNIRPKICIIFGFKYDAASASLLNAFQMRIDTKIFKKELKLYQTDKERFERKHYLEDFPSLTQSEKDLWWNATQKPREQLKLMMNSKN
jgi:hypothetical protein